MDRDYYADLGVSRNASADEIGSAFRKLAARYHPDRNPGDRKAEENFKRIAEAYNVLRDPKSRAAYDRGGSEQVEIDTGFRGFDSTEDIFSHFGDVFGDLFGARFRSRAYRRWPDEFDVEPEPVRDLHQEVTISVFTALLGGTVDVPTAQGTAEMTIPAGTQPERKFRLAGQGLSDPGGRRGDVIVTVHVDVPRRLTPAQRSLLEQARRTR